MGHAPPFVQDIFCVLIDTQGLFLSVLPKTQFPENAKTQFENPKTQFGNCKTKKIGNFTQVTKQIQFPESLHMVQPAENPFRNQIFIHECHDKPIQKYKNSI